MCTGQNGSLCTFTLSHKLSSLEACDMKQTILAILAALFSITSYAATKAPASSPAMIEKGKASYAANCATCHGDSGDGMGPAGQYMNPKPRNFSKDKFKKGDKVEQIFQTITKGLAGTAMTAYGHLSEDDRWALSHYIVSLRSKK